MVRPLAGFRPFVCAAVASAAFALATPASAAPLLFTFTGFFNGSFRLDSNPVPTFVDVDHFSVGIAAQTGDFAKESEVSFYTSANSAGGGLISGPGNFVDVYGPELYSGTFANPVFSPGAFVLSDLSGSRTIDLAIAAPGAPLPDLGGGLVAGVIALVALATTRLRLGRRFA